MGKRYFSKRAFIADMGASGYSDNKGWVDVIDGFEVIKAPAPSVAPYEDVLYGLSVMSEWTEEREDAKA